MTTTGAAIRHSPLSQPCQGLVNLLCITGSYPGTHWHALMLTRVARLRQMESGIATSAWQREQQRGVFSLAARSMICCSLLLVEQFLPEFVHIFVLFATLKNANQVHVRQQLDCFGLELLVAFD